MSARLHPSAAVIGAGALALALCPSLIRPSHAQTTTLRATDAASGRDKRNYPPHRLADVQHIRLEVTIPDMNVRRMSVVERITFAPIASELATLSLNAANLDTISARAEGYRVSFTLDAANERIVFAFDPPIPRGRSVHLDLKFDVLDPAEGLYWTPESPDFPGRPAQLHTLGESSFNRYWFIGPDFPNERFTSEVIARVPKGFEAISNGRLVDRSLVPARSGDPELEQFHFTLERAHVMYLVSLVVGKFEVTDVGTQALPMPVYAPPGTRQSVQRTYARTPQMIELFEHLTGQAYPWPVYAQVLCHNFLAGGMEHSGATTLTDSALLDERSLIDGDKDDLISHELAHQWFGDLVTCASWEHIWLNEGFATYFEKLWEQYRRSPQWGAQLRSQSAGNARDLSTLTPDNDAYQSAMWDDFRQVMDADKADALHQPPMVSKEYLHADEVFDREANPYPKGSSIVHMLRMRLGDAVFFKGLRSYLASYKDDIAETSNLRRSFERASGTNLEQFFDQWCLRPGVPDVLVTAQWDSERSELVVRCEQRQPIDAENLPFDVQVAITLRCAGESSFKQLSVRCDRASREQRFALPDEPNMLTVNDDLSVLARFSLDQPTVWTLSAIEAAPTLAGRLIAASALARTETSGKDQGRVAQGLARLASDTRLHPAARTECLRTLALLANPGAYQDEDDSGARVTKQGARAAVPEAASALVALNGSPAMSNPLVRLTFVRALAQGTRKTSEVTRARVSAMLRTVYETDQSFAVRGAAIEGLGALRADEGVQSILAALKAESPFDILKQAGIKALRTAPSPGALQIAIRMTDPGEHPRTRTLAIQTIASLRTSGPDLALDRVLELSHDPERRARNAAIEALGKFNNRRAKERLTDLARNAPGSALTALAQRTLEEIEERAEPETSTEP